MRLELLHPLLVHFPIALLSTGVILRLVSVWVDKKSLRQATWILLILGLVMAVIAAIAGMFAAEIVSPTLENLEILREHVEHALYTAIGFTIAILLDWLRTVLLKKRKKSRWMVRRGLAGLIALMYFFGFGNLLLTGYFGAALVYEQGAAVKKSM